MELSRLMAPGLAALLSLLPAAALANGCGMPAPAGTAWQYKNGVLFKSRVLNVDADGAPNAYLVDGKGLSYTCDGVVAVEHGTRINGKNDPAGWQQKCRSAWRNATMIKNYSGVAIFGFETDKNKVPLVQGRGDPLPGKAFVSATSVVIPGAPAGTQRRYVDATQIPYIVLSATFVDKYKVKPGTLAVVYRPQTGRHAFAVFADSGNLGEASIRLHRDLGSNPMQLKDGIDRAKARIEDPTVTVVFPDRVAPPRPDAGAWNAIIKQEGNAGLEAFGGIDALKACAR